MITQNQDFLRWTSLNFKQKDMAGEKPHYCGKNSDSIGSSGNLQRLLSESSSPSFPGFGNVRIAWCCGVFQSWDFTHNRGNMVFHWGRCVGSSHLCCVKGLLVTLKGDQMGNIFWRQVVFFWKWIYVHDVYIYIWIYVRLGEVEDVLHISFWNWRGINAMPSVRSRKPQKLNVFVCILLHFAR